MVCLRNVCMNTLHKGDNDEYNNNNNNNNNNIATISNNCERFRDLILLFIIPMGPRKNFFAVYRQFGHALSKRFLSRVVGNAEEGGEEAGTNYRDPAVRKGARVPTMLRMCLSLSVVSSFSYRYLSTAQINPFRPNPSYSATDSLADLL